MPDRRLIQGAIALLLTLVVAAVFSPPTWVVIVGVVLALVIAYPGFVATYYLLRRKSSEWRTGKSYMEQWLDDPTNPLGVPRAEDCNCEGANRPIHPDDLIDVITGHEMPEELVRRARCTCR